MSENHIPSHIQEEIMKRLPVKSLLQFRSVSKTWKSLIDSSKFITSHTLHHHTHPHHLLIWYWDQTDQINYICGVDDYTFPQQRYIPTLPLSIKQLKLARVVGSSHGLLCFYGYLPDFKTKLAVLWNPSIRKHINVAVPGESSLSFGVCPTTHNPKIIAITQSRDFTHCEVMIYGLSSGKWNPSSNFPDTPIRDVWSSVVTNRFIYWIAGLDPKLIMSFDVTNEKFKLVDLPDSLARDPPRFLSISKIGECLAVLENRENICTVVWMMEDGVESFKKMFSIQTPEYLIVGFRKSGIPVMLVTGDDEEPCGFVVYEPNMEHANFVETSGSSFIFNLNSYMESLHFLDRSDSNSY